MLRFYKSNFGVYRSIYTTRNLAEDHKPSFLDRVFGTKVEKATQAHSVHLANQQILYELQIHNVKPDKCVEYQAKYNEYVPNMLKRYSNVKLAGSWKSEIGVLDQFGNLFY